MKTILIVMVAVLAVVAGGLGYMGLFNPVEVQEREAGPFEFIYVQDTGTDFGRVRELTEKLGQRLEQAGFTRRRPAQVYFPAGRNIPNQIGFVVDRLATSEVLTAETFYMEIPAQRCMAARFPFRFAWSFVLGQLRVAPAFAGHREDKRYAETRTIVIREGDHILYLQPIEPA